MVKISPLQFTHAGASTFSHELGRLLFGRRGAILSNISNLFGMENRHD